MKKSESITEIAKALCKFQSEIKDAPKDSQAYKYKYADLGTILQIVRPVMASHGLSVVQFPISEDDKVGINTILLHTSGEWMENSMLVQVTPSAKMSLAQQAGSVLTYVRRYSVAAVLGITQVDDDAVVEHVQRPPAKPDNQVKQEAKPASKPKAKPATEDQKILIGEFKLSGILPEKTEAWMAGKELSYSQAAKVLAVCRKQDK